MNTDNNVLSEIERVKEAIIGALDSNCGSDKPVRFRALIASIHAGSKTLLTESTNTVLQVAGFAAHNHKDFNDLRRTLMTLQALREVLDDIIGTDNAA